MSGHLSNRRGVVTTDDALLRERFLFWGFDGKTWSRGRDLATLGTWAGGLLVGLPVWGLLFSAVLVPGGSGWAVPPFAGLAAVVSAWAAGWLLPRRITHDEPWPYWRAVWRAERVAPRRPAATWVRHELAVPWQRLRGEARVESQTGGEQ